MGRRILWAAGTLAVFILASGVFPSSTASVARAADQNTYFDELVKRRDFWKGYSLRPRAGEPITSPYYELQLKRNRDGGYSDDDSYPYVVEYDPAMDAAKIVIPPFHIQAIGALVSQVRSSIPGAVETIKLTWTKGFDNGRGLLIDDEIMVVKRISGSAPSQDVTVVRGQYGTTASAHRANTPVNPSQNSLANQVRVPLGTEDGHTYFFTWDGYWTDSYLRVGFNNHKAFQFTSGERIWLQPDTRFDGGAGATRTPGGIARPAEWDPNVHVAGLEIRAYLKYNGPTRWADSDGWQMGPGTTYNEPINPKSGAMVLYPNRWTRFFLRIQQRANDYDLMDYWAADEHQDPVQIYRSVPVSVPNGTIEQFWLEFNTSTLGFTRGDRRDLVNYVRNFAALRDPGDVTSLLQRPLPSTVQTAPVSAPSAPRNLRIIR